MKLRFTTHILFLTSFLFLAGSQTLCAQGIREQSDDGFNVSDTQYDQSRNTFRPNKNDSTRGSKEIPKGIKVWTVDRKFGDIIPAEVDTMPHLFPQSTLAAGKYGQYNTIGTNYAARQNRIFIDRREKSQFGFLDVYDQVMKTPDERHFTQTLSPITNLTYDNCGDKQNGEDHLDAKFAVNVGKRLGVGFDVNYAYARGYYQNQSVSHFGATFYASYRGDQYQLHAIYSTYHQKATENGGITNDNYITHPELSGQSFNANEIPVFLQQHWNRNDNDRFFLTHRYAVGFYRQVKMTEEEIEAKKFAMAAAKEKAAAEAKATAKAKADSLGIDVSEVLAQASNTNDTLVTDSTTLFMKREFVPVTSFIHTAEAGTYDRRYTAYATPKDYFANTYYNYYDNSYGGDSINDITKHLYLKNTLAIALLEGFNKYVPAGLKVFATHELRRFEMPALTNGIALLERTTEHNISIGGQLIRSQGHTLHYNAKAETWIIGEDLGQLKLDGSADVNFPLFGDTVRLAAKAYIHRLNPTFYERHYHAKHFWWDNSMSHETRTRIEGAFTYEKTNTTLRVGIEEIQNYTYYGMSYTCADEKHTLMQAGVHQHGGNLNVMTAQLDQKFRLGPLHWDNLLTYQSSSNEDVLPLPTLNVFSNLYLEFMVAKVLRVELGGSATWFTEYNAPEFCSALNQIAVQENTATRTKIGNFPFVDVYANLHLKHARFFLLMQNATNSSFNRAYFLTPHYPMNASVLHFGISWNFFN